MRVWFSTLLMGAMLALGSARAEAQSQTFYVGNWEGWPYYNEYTGAFERCLVAAPYRNNIYLAISIEADFGLKVGMINDNWQIPEGSEFSLRMSVDQRWSKSVTGFATSGDSVFVALGQDYEAFEALQRGRELVIDAARETFRFGLQGSSRALMAAAQCVFERIEVASTDPFSSQTNPFTGSGSSASRGGSSQRNSGIEEGAVAALLLASGLDAAEMLPEWERRDLFPNAHYAWRVGNVYGVLVSGLRSGLTPEELVAAEIAALARTCTGRFANGTVPAEMADDVLVKRFFMTCLNQEDSFAISATLVIGADDFALFEHVGALEIQAEVAEVDERVAKTLQGDFD